MLVFMVICSKYWFESIILCFVWISIERPGSRTLVSSGMQCPLAGAGGKAYNRLYCGPGLRWRHWADTGHNGGVYWDNSHQRDVGSTFFWYSEIHGGLQLLFNWILCNWVTSWNVNVVQGCRITVTDCIFCGKSRDKPTDFTMTNWNE